jgi:hypothetical protein
MFRTIAISFQTVPSIRNARKSRFHAGFLHSVPYVLDVLDVGESEQRAGEYALGPRRPRFPLTVSAWTRNTERPERSELTPGQCATYCVPDIVRDAPIVAPDAETRPVPHSLGFARNLGRPVPKKSRPLPRDYRATPRNARVYGANRALTGTRPSKYTEKHGATPTFAPQTRCGATNHGDDR